MQWNDIREHYPASWLLVKALKAHSAGGKRIVEDLAILEKFPDSTTALARYRELHREAPERELYVFHTDREELDVTERRWLGVRGIMREYTAEELDAFIEADRLSEEQRSIANRM